MKVILEIDHTVSKEEIVNWIEEVLKPNTPCVWGYSFEEHHCGSCHNSQLEKENAELKKEIEKRSMYEKHIEYENEQLKEQNENKREEIKMLRNEHKQDMVIHNNYVNKVEELKAHCKAVDEVNDKMKNCMNCKNGIVDDEDVCGDCNSENCWKNWEIKE